SDGPTPGSLRTSRRRPPHPRLHPTPAPPAREDPLNTAPSPPPFATEEYHGHRTMYKSKPLYMYDVARDGQSFIVARRAGGRALAPPVPLIHNWTAALRK